MTTRSAITLPDLPFPIVSGQMRAVQEPMAGQRPLSSAQATR